MKKLNILESKWIIGMIHCLPLPGTRDYAGSMQRVVDRALFDLDAMERAGVDAVIVENFCDRPAPHQTRAGADGRFIRCQYAGCTEEWHSCGN